MVSDIVKDYSRTVLWRVASRLPQERIERDFEILRRRSESEFKKENWIGAIAHHCSIDVRYRGQGYELNIPYTQNLIRAFREEHQRRYGYNYPSRDLELVTLRLRSVIKSPRVRTDSRLSTTESPALTRRSGNSNKPSDNRAAVYFAGKKWQRQFTPATR